MNWYYVDAGQQAGPVDEAQLAELVRAGRIQPETLVWREGMANWQPYREVAAGSTPPTGAPAAFSPVYGSGAYATAGLPQPQAAGITEAELLARDYDVDIGGSLSRAWEVFKPQAGLITGACVLVGLAFFAVSVLSLPLAFMKQVPLLNLLPLLLIAPLLAGLWLFFIKLVRNQEAPIGDVFSGFGPRYGQLLLTQLIVALPTFILSLLWRYMGFEAFFQALLQHATGSGPLPTPPDMLLVWSLVLFLFSVLAVFLSTCWLFALPLAADKGLSFWRALEVSRTVVMKHWWMTFWLLTVCSVVACLGLLLCCVGVLFTGPLAVAPLAAHYQRVFGDLAPQSV